MDENHKLIVVLGLDGGGTSIIAGTLWHLGVDMGKIAQDPKTFDWSHNSGRPRNYLKYEDEDAQYRMHEGEKNNTYDSQKLVYNMWEYIDKRQDAAQGKPYGVKHPGIVMVGSRTEQLQKMPIRCVYIHRPLEDVFKSNIRDLGPENYMQAQLLGLRIYCLELFLKSLPPVATFEFDEVLAHPRQAIFTLMKALDLKPDPKEMNRAMKFIDPVKKGCGINYD